MKPGQPGISRKATSIQREWNNGAFGRTAAAPDAIISVPRPKPPKSSWWDAPTREEFNRRAAEREAHWKATLPQRDLESEVW